MQFFGVLCTVHSLIDNVAGFRIQLLSIRSSQSIELHLTPVLRNVKLLIEAKHHSIFLYKLIL